MRLVSSNGNAVELRIESYEFPSRSPSDKQDYDANWLIIKGDVANDGRTWSFRDPCMTTWDARELAGWLRSVADGSKRPEPVDPDNEGGGLLEFLEPNVAFNLHARTASESTLRVFLSAEALPPDADREMFEYFVEVSVTNDQIATALKDWEVEVRQFPVRT